MKGTMLIYEADATEPTLRVFIDSSPKLKELQAAVGGRIETVPYFDHIRVNGERREAVAFCNEEGKVKGLPVNRQATLIWAQVLDNNGMTIRDEHGDFLDMLVGPVIVLYGDEEFMRAL